MKHLIPFLLIVLIGFSSCHSNNNVSPSPNLWGDFSVSKRTSDSNFIFPNIDDETAIAEFYSSANTFWKRVPVTKISVNGWKMSDNGDSQYVDIPGPGIATHVLWDVVGANGVPSFSYDDIGAFPEYTGPKMPDAIVRANGLTLSFPTGTIPAGDSVRIVFNEYGQSFYKGMDGNGNIVFTPNELNRLPVGMNYMNVQVYKSKLQTFGGKQYVFAKERIYMSNVMVQ